MPGKTTTTHSHGPGAEPAPARLCALSRSQKPTDDLIRFVVDPEGSIVPDLGLRLPGRGVWVSATRADVAAAIRQKVFARSLKRAVSVPVDLTDRIERLMIKRVVEALSLANKAGLVVAGFAKVEGLLAQERAAILIHATDAALDGAAKLDRIFKALRGPERAAECTIGALNSGELSLAIGRSNVIHAAASEGGTCRRIVQEARRLTRYRMA